MKIGPKYKLARRLGPLFEKTQTHKFSLRESSRFRLSPRPRSDFGIQLLEKQKARFLYGIPERQFRRYAKEAIAQRRLPAEECLFLDLETRLDNVVYRLGVAPTRLAARQLVSHGHITVNGKKVRIPSCHVRVGDVIAVRSSSQQNKIFADLPERLKEVEPPMWLSREKQGLTAEVRALPLLHKNELVFDIGLILEFYRR